MLRRSINAFRFFFKPTREASCKNKIGKKEIYIYDIKYKVGTNLGRLLCGQKTKRKMARIRFVFVFFNLMGTEFA